MAKYLIKANLTAEGLKGTLKEGGTARREAVKKAIESMGGTLESYYYAFGQKDIVGIVDMPDNASVAAFALMVTAAGGATISTMVLLTPEEIDEAAKKTGSYRPPGK